MVTKAELYLNALLELKNSTGNILATAMVTLGGLVMASTTSDEINKETFAAYSAATFKRAGEAMEELSREDIDMLLFESGNYRVVIVRAVEYILLIALTGKDVQVGLVLINMQNTARKIREIS